MNKIENSNSIIVSSDCEILVYSTKSISFKYIIHSKITEDYVKAITESNPHYIAISFVEDYKDVQIYKDIFSGANIISKVETLNGIKNLDDIAKESDIMLGRGDLFLNANVCDLFFYQLNVKDVVHKYRRSFYLATGLLASLEEKRIPSQADIIDLTNALLLNTDYLIFNYGVMKESSEAVTRLCEDIYHSIIEHCN